MTTDRRRQERTEIDEVAYISRDGSSLRCRVKNISDHGGCDRAAAQALYQSTIHADARA